MPDSSSLVSIEDYLRITQDTSAQSDTDLQPALDEALGLIQDNISRVLVYGTYVETLRIYKNGAVYPSATPLAAVVSPALPAGCIQGAAIYMGMFNPAPIINYGYGMGAITPQATITYTGGFTSATLPIKLKRALCRAAFNILNPSQLTGLPGGVNRVQVGDVGYSAAGSGSLRTFEALDDGILADIKGFRNQNWRGWQIAPVQVD